MSNPYATYQSAPNQFPNKKQSTDGFVTAPAIALIVVAIIGLIGMIVYFVLTLIGISTGATQLPQTTDEAERIGQQIGFYGAIAGMGLNILLQFLILTAGILMLKRKNYVVCLLGTIAAGIPFLGSSCCIIGIPFSIWAFVVLMNQDVKASFR